MLVIRHSRVFHGPSIWAPVPAIVLEVDIGPLAERLSRETPAFFAPLTALVPAMSEYAALVGQPDGGLQCLLLDRLCIALQHWAGAEDTPLTFCHTLADAQPGRYHVVYQFQHADVGRAAGTLAVRLLNHLVVQPELGFDLDAALKETLRPVARPFVLTRSAAPIVVAANRRGIPVAHLSHKPLIIQLGNGAYQCRVGGTMTSNTGSPSMNIAHNKELTTRLLREAGLPVPSNAAANSADTAVRAARRIGYPVVLKPLANDWGRGVMIDLASESEVRAAFPIAAGESRSGTILVERYISGKDYRILVIGYRIAAVVERVPAHVVGDGTHTVQELLEITNQDPRRGPGHSKLLARISINTQTHDALAKQNLDLGTVPEAGRHVQLKLTGNLSTGGTAIDRTDDIHPDNAAVACQAARVIGLDIAGVDLITPDIARSFRESGGAIVEVNEKPGIGMHKRPSVGKSRDVGMAVVDMLYPPGKPFRVPIVAVTGTNGKTTTSRMIAHIMKTAGRKVGMTCTDGIFIGDMQIATGDRGGPASARKVLRNPAVDFAVLETARGGILRDGLGFQHCDVAVVTNVSTDHQGLDGIDTLAELARVYAVVPRSVFPGGARVLNADDEWTARMADRPPGEIIYFSMAEANPIVRGHLREGGQAVALRQTPAGEMLTLLDKTTETSLLLAEEIPATLDGRIRVNIQNAMAAAAAAIALDMPIDGVCRALRTFTSGYIHTPGRFNLLELDGRKVLLDYCHNVAGLEAMADFVKRMGAGRAIGMIEVPGDRSDADIAAYGSLAARSFDELVIRDDLRRGRKRGEAPALLYAAAIAGGLPPDKISVVADKERAVEVAIEKGGEQSLVVLMVDAVTEVWSQLTRGRTASGVR